MQDCMCSGTTKCAYHSAKGVALRKLKPELDEEDIQDECECHEDCCDIEFDRRIIPNDAFSIPANDNNDWDDVDA